MVVSVGQQKAVADLVSNRTFGRYFCSKAGADLQLGVVTVREWYGGVRPVDEGKYCMMHL